MIENSCRAETFSDCAKWLRTGILTLPQIPDRLGVPASASLVSYEDVLEKFLHEMNQTDETDCENKQYSH